MIGYAEDEGEPLTSCRLVRERKCPADADRATASSDKVTVEPRAAGQAAARGYTVWCLQLGEHLHGQLAQALLTDGNRPAAFGAANNAAGGQGGKDHVLKRLPVAQGIPGAFLRHAVDNLL